MRKLLIILFILMFSIGGVCAEITAGGGASIRSGNSGDDLTSVDLNNPANGTGKLTKFYIYAGTNMTNVVVSTTYQGASGTGYFTTRDYVNIGNVTAGAMREFDIDLEVVEGDWLTVSFPTGTLRYDGSGGAGIYATGANRVPMNNFNIPTLYSGLIISIHATGSTEDDETIYIGKWDTKSATTISKWNGAVTSGTPIDNSVYISPDNHSSDWTNGVNGIDGNTNTNTTRSVTRSSWSSYYTVNFNNPITSDKVRVWTHNSISTSYFTDHEVDYYDGTSWTNIGSGAISKNQWVVYPLGGEKTLSQVRVRYYNTNSSSRTCYLGEVEIYKIDATLGGSMLLWNTYEWEN